MTIGSLLEGGFRPIKERPGAMLIWTLIQLVVMIGASYATAAIVQGSIDSLLSGTPRQSVELSSSMQTLLLGLVELIFSAVLYAAMQRSIIRPTEGGPGWLRFGMDEVRYYLLMLLYIIVGIVAVIIFSIVFGIFFAGAGPSGVQTMAIMMLVLGFVACSYFGTKLSLTFPLTLKEQSFSIGAGWSLSSGRFWTLYGAYFIIFLIMVAVGIANLAITQADYFSAIFQYGFTSPEAEMASIQQSQKLIAGTIDSSIIIGWIFGAVVGTISAALFAGAAATAVQQLTADEEGLSETFS